MKENSKQTPIKPSSTYSYELKTLEHTKLLNQVNLLKNKLRVNRNSETRKKLEYRMAAVEQDIAGYKTRQQKDRQNTKATAEKLEQEIKQSLQTLKELEGNHQTLRKQQDQQKLEVGSRMNSNKELADKLCLLEREKKEKMEQLSKLERTHRLEVEDIRRLEFTTDRLKAEQATLDEKQVKLNDKLQKLAAVNSTWRQKVSKQQQSIQECGEQMKKLFRQANNQLLEQQRSMHKHLLVRDGLKEAEHRLREQNRKLQELTDMHKIELQRSQIISKRAEETTRLTQTLEMPKNLEEKVAEDTAKLANLKQKLTAILEQNKQKHKLNEQVIQKMHSLVQPDELFRAHLLRQQQIKQLQSKHKIESYAWISGSQPRLYESRQKPRNYAYGISQSKQPSPMKSLSSSFNRSAMKSALNQY